MPRYIMKIGDLYGEWSTVVDAPVTWLMSREEFEAYYREEYGRRATEEGEFKERMARVEEKGTSSRLDRDAHEVMSLNRVGPGGTRLSVKKVIEWWERETAESKKEV